MSTDKWVMNRAGLVNFWYYDEEIFHLLDGKLLLRGSNGSGKSVTMQSFLPVLLDGKKSPDRLDPFGSKARKMEDYLLGEKEVSDLDERTGYLFIEYKKQGVEQYITTGIGMQAKRNKTMKTWYFFITDNRRIGEDFYLRQKHAGEIVPLSAKELENRIGQGGYVVHTQREYMELVNKYVFGFPSVEAYEDLIKLLIQLRSPKLSKDFKPTVIYEILESALPPLTDDELRHLSDTIENMDQTQQQLEQLAREYESIQRLEAVYDTYNTFILTERAEQWKSAQQKQQAAEQNVEALARQHEAYQQEIAQLIAAEQQYRQQKQVAEQAKESLQKHEVWSLEKGKVKKEAEASGFVAEIKQLESKLEERNRKRYQSWKEQESIEIESSEHQQKAKELLTELEIDAEAAAFYQHEVNIQDYERNQLDTFDFSVWSKEAKEHQTLVSSLAKLAEEADRLSEEYTRFQRESSEKKRSVDEHQKELDHLQAWFDEQHQELESKVFVWMEEHPKLVYSTETHQEISRLLQGLYERNRFEIVREKLYPALHAYEAKINTERALIEKEAEQKRAEIKGTEAELLQIKTQKMIEPVRAKGTEEHRDKLNKQGQAYLPFYAAVEFKEHVTEGQRERIEASLTKMGILDSLLTDRVFSPEQDAVFVKQPRLLGYTLAELLQPDVDEDSPISKAIVEDVLRTIPLEKNEHGFYLDVDGSYAMGCLVGHAPNEGPSKYIGRTSRKRHQREQIQLYTEKLLQLEEELAQLQGKRRKQLEELQLLENWKQQLPTDHDLADLDEQIIAKKHLLKHEQEALRKIDEAWKVADEQLHKVKQELREQGTHLNIPLTKEELGQALTSISSYIDFLHQFQRVSLQVSFATKQLASIGQRIEEIEDELLMIKGEQNSKQTQLAQIRAEITSMEEQLQLKGVDEVRKRIQDVQRSFEQAEAQIAMLLRTIPQKEAAQTSCLEKLTSSKQEFSFWKHMNEEWAHTVETEINRGFVNVDVFDAEAISAQYESVFAKYDRTKLLEQLTKVFFKEQLYLTEYRMFEFTEDMETPVWFQEDFGDYYEPFKNEWHQLKSRRLIQMEYHGQRVSPYYVEAALKKELDEQKGWLDEQDRQLYEDIIVNTVGRILRERIKRAEKWVKEMDTIMANRDNSSGLIFSIAWKPRTAESEQELDTKDLVKLLQRNSKFLNDEDLQRITIHFQSRIARAKELIQLRNEGSTLHQVLKEVLDYRKWFTFELSFKRVHEKKRELSNNAFFKFSGGEKAMAMYIPLFTAAYSRYKEASDTAPYIITLDEAFAGVDENNIRDMFEVVEQLGFNYIMNSQALWGDYDTISSLAIAELVRPKNANYVTVIRYEWDGKQKSVVIDEDRLEELVLHEQ